MPLPQWAEREVPLLHSLKQVLTHLSALLGPWLHFSTNNCLTLPTGYPLLLVCEGGLLDFADIAEKAQLHYSDLVSKFAKHCFVYKYDSGSKVIQVS